MTTKGKNLFIDTAPIQLSTEDLQIITDSLISAICIDDELAADLVRRLVLAYRQPSRRLLTIEELALNMAS